MNAWEEPVDVRIAAAQAHLMERIHEARKPGAQPCADRAEAPVEPVQ